MVPVRDGNVTQYEAKECEAAGLIKYDFLVINQLKDIRVCLDLVNKRNGEKNVVGTFTHQGQSTYIWKLPEMDEVFKSVWGGACETIFQINTKSMIPYVMEILPGSIMDLATILALVRPGPMDFIDEKTGRNMVEEYILRRRKESEADIKELMELLPETFGIITFQEQLNKIARDLAGFPGEKAEKLRKNMAKKKMKELMDMKPDFMAGATQRVGAEVAEGIWERMVTFGRYGFSIIHAVEYALITYASMFLKHYYPLEWWAAILTNAQEQEITGVFWPHVKDIVSPPDINLSSDTMAVDYANGKIRSKLGVIRGIGDATIEPIVTNRPYADIQDFVDKKVAGPGLSHKLIHVGVLDSLFPPKSTLLEKLKLFENAVEVNKFQDKLEKAKISGKKVKLTQPKDGVIPEEYINLHPIKDAAMRKAVLQSLPIDMFQLGKKYSKVLNPESYKTVVINQRGYDTLLINGERLKRLDELAGESVEKDIYVAATCFIVKAEEFSYPKKNPTKRALKIILDADGYVSEKVLWPDYESGELLYPKEFKKGAIATVFFRKKAGRKDMNITYLVVET
jgi:DNA polymerase III alpha subunit